MVNVMLTTTIKSIKSIMRELSECFSRIERALVTLGAERRCAYRLDELADRVRGMGGRVDMLRTCMRARPLNEVIDADFSLREALKELKEDVREIRCQLATLQGAQALTPRLERAFERLSTISETTYRSADKLQWEIGAHEQRVADQIDR